MIIVHASARIPAADLARVRSQWSDLIPKSKAEAGCLEYSVSFDAYDPEVVKIRERWTSEDALRAHAQSQHVTDWRRATADVKFSDEELHIFAADAKDVNEFAPYD